MTEMRPQPLCTCHGIGACVHRENFTQAAGGRDLGRGWAWHCALRPEGCEGFSAVLLVAEEWLSAEERARLTRSHEHST